MKKHLEDGWRGKLGLFAKAAVIGIVGPGHPTGDPIHLAMIRFPTGRHPRNVVLALAVKLGRLIINPRLVLVIGPLDFHQHRQQLVGGQIRSPRNHAPVGSQESGGGPAANVVTGVHVGPVVIVHQDGNVVIIYEAGHLGVGKSRFLHHVAPVAPNRRNGQQHGPVHVLGLDKSLLAPMMPPDAAASFSCAVISRHQMVPRGLDFAMLISAKSRLTLA